MKIYIFKNGKLCERKARRVDIRLALFSALRILAAGLVVLAPVFLASCAPEKPQAPSQQPRLVIETPDTLYCAAYGLRVDLPEGWLIHSRNKSNLTEEDSLTTLLLTEYENGHTVELCELWSEESSSDEAHASLAMYVEVFDDITIADYIDALTSTLNGRRDGYVSALTSSETQNDGERDWYVLVAAVAPPIPANTAEASSAASVPSSGRYIEEYRITEVGENAYFVACITWWENSTASLEAATVSRTVYSITR